MGINFLLGIDFDNHFIIYIDFGDFSVFCATKKSNVRTTFNSKINPNSFHDKRRET